MFCTNCGVQNGESSAFCIQCGTALQGNPPTAHVQQNSGYASAVGSPAYQTQVMTAPAKRPNYTLIGIISVAVVAVIVTVIVLLCVSGGNPLVGTWHTAPDDFYEQTVTFTRNGMIKVESSDYTQTAQYKVKGKSLTLIFNGEIESGEFKITKEKGRTKLILMSEGEETLVLYKK